MCCCRRYLPADRCPYCRAPSPLPPPTGVTMTLPGFLSALILANPSPRGPSSPCARGSPSGSCPTPWAHLVEFQGQTIGPTRRTSCFYAAERGIIQQYLPDLFLINFVHPKSKGGASSTCVSIVDAATLSLSFFLFSKRHTILPHDCAPTPRLD